MIVFPMVTPLLIAGVSGTRILLDPLVGETPWVWLQFTWGFSIVFGAIGIFLFEMMVTE